MSSRRNGVYKPDPERVRRLRCFIRGQRERFGLHTFPVDAAALAASLPGMTVELRPFSGPEFHGALFRGDPFSLILLNRRRSPAQRNFDAAHELMHYWCDPAEGRLSVEQARPSEDPAAEWRCNEGAAELLVPMADFAALAVREAGVWHKGNLPELLLNTPFLFEAASRYMVSEGVIKVRIRQTMWWMRELNKNKML